MFQKRWAQDSVEIVLEASFFVLRTVVQEYLFSERVVILVGLLLFVRSSRVRFRFRRIFKVAELSTMTSPLQPCLVARLDRF